MIAAVYARKSTEQGVPDEAKSVTRQVEHATAYAARKGWTVDPTHVYVDDAISGAEFVNRPGLARLLTALSPRPPFDVLILAEPSRLGREQIETAYTLKRITDAGVAVWYYLDDRRAAMDSALAKVMASLSGFASESERELARARTYDALARKAKAGHVAGGIVYGYVNVRVDGHVERRVLEAEASAVRRIFELYAGGTGLRTIAKTLTAEGAPPPTRRQRDRIPGWGPASLREILRRELYRGEITWNRRKKTDRGGRTKVRVIRPETDLVRVADERLRIVEDDLWQRCQARRVALAATKPAGTWTRSARVVRPALLSGLGRCGVCGAGLVRATRAHGSARQRRHVSMYTCGRTSRGLPCTNRVALEETTVDAAILDALAKALARQTLDQALDLALEELRAERASGQAQRQTLERELAQVATRQARLAVAIAQGEAMTPLLDQMRREETRKAEIVAALAALDAQARLGDVAGAKARTLLQASATDVLGALERHPGEARAVLAAFVSSITFSPFGRGRDRGFDFEGDGDYAPLIGTTCARAGIPSGTPEVPMPPSFGVSLVAAVMLTRAGT
jgi:DNA invertase Pin-like site-specific DNA recombinase